MTVGPVRILCVWLPLPTWDKNSRTGVVLRNTARMKAGRRFLAPVARDYRDLVTRLVRPALPARPWFDKRRPWHISLVQYIGDTAADADHFLSGILDDLCNAGLVENDSEAQVSRLVHVRQEPKGIYVIASQEIA